MTHKKVKSHFYQSIEGFFSFRELYKAQVEKASNGFHFVEVGVYLGRSAAYMAVEIANSGKDIKFDCVDTWSLWPQSVKELKMKNVYYKKFIKNMKPVQGYYNAIQLKSIEAAQLYQDNSLDFVFIDAHHIYEEVIQDIQLWYPKVKIGGTLAGHDYYTENHLYPEVKKAVDEYIQDTNLNIDLNANTWAIIKSDECKQIKT